MDENEIKTTSDEIQDAQTEEQSPEENEVLIKDKITSEKTEEDSKEMEEKKQEPPQDEESDTRNEDNETKNESDKMNEGSDDDKNKSHKIDEEKQRKTEARDEERKEERQKEGVKAPSFQDQVINVLATIRPNALLAIKRKRQHRLELIMGLALKEKQKGRKITNDDVEKLLYVSNRSASRYLSMLTQKGMLRRFGHDGGTSYEIV